MSASVLALALLVAAAASPAPGPARSATPSPGATGAVSPSPTAAEPTPVVTDADLAALRARALAFPVPAVRWEDVRGTFADPRGSAPHEALDIAAPRGTPVVAVDDGVVTKLFASVPGGLTIYLFDRAARFAYYYAHLDGYAPGLAEGQPVARGATLGYVGSSGNAAPDAPHLHFAIFKLEQPARWWRGTALDPYPVLRPSTTDGAR